jgi:hypothetical protein
MFGNSVYILNLMTPNADPEGAEAGVEADPLEDLWEASFKEPFVDSLFN